MQTAVMSLQFTHVRSFACRGKLRNSEANFSAIGLCCVTITRQQTLEDALQVTVAVAFCRM